LLLERASPLAKDFLLLYDFWIPDKHLKFTNAIAPQTLSKIVLQTSGKHKGNKFTFLKAGKLQYTSINSLMNCLVLDVPAMMTEAQLKRYCAIFTLDSAIKIDASLFAQYVSDSLIVSSIIVQTFNATPTPSIITVQTRYCAVNLHV
jgi:hypothetical protein